MSALTNVFVTVPEGREVPIPASEGSSAGGSALRLLPGKVYAVKWTTYTRKRIAGGDLILSSRFGTKVETPELARAEASIKLDADGAVSSEQRTDVEINLAAAKDEAAKNAAASVVAVPEDGNHRGSPSSTKSPTFDTSDAKGKA